MKGGCYIKHGVLSPPILLLPLNICSKAHSPMVWASCSKPSFPLSTHFPMNESSDMVGRRHSSFSLSTSLRTLTQVSSAAAVDCSSRPVARPAGARNVRAATERSPSYEGSLREQAAVFMHARLVMSTNQNPGL